MKCGEEPISSPAIKLNPMVVGVLINSLSKIEGTTSRTWSEVGPLTGAELVYTPTALFLTLFLFISSSLLDIFEALLISYYSLSSGVMASLFLLFLTFLPARSSTCCFPLSFTGLPTRLTIYSYSSLITKAR